MSKQTAEKISKKRPSDTDQRPSIFEYWDIRQFIKDYVRYLKYEESLSLRQLAKVFGLKNAGHLSLVLAGKRPIGIPLIKKFERAFRLQPEESKCFFTLYEYSLADGDVERRRLQLALIAQQKHFKIKKIDSVVAHFLGQWQFQVIHEVLVEARSFKELLDLCAELDLSENELRGALQHLHQLGLVEKLEGERFKRKHARLQTSPELINEFNRMYHQTMARKASEAIDQVGPKEREYLGLTLGMTREDFEILRKELLEFQQNLNGRYGESSEVELVYQINVQAFPLLDLRKSSPKKLKD
jgi:uncharacterized protein (TIGR02147 family)